MARRHHKRDKGHMLREARDRMDAGHVRKTGGRRKRRHAKGGYR